VKVATLDLSTELFVEFSKASGMRGGLTRSFVVAENPLPDDAEVVAVEAHEVYAMGALPLLRLHIKSESYAEVAEGETPPELPLVIYRTIYEKAQ
jgi:hypothetical protein